MTASPGQAIARGPRSRRPSVRSMPTQHVIVLARNRRSSNSGHCRNRPSSAVRLGRTVPATRLSHSSRAIVPTGREMAMPMATFRSPWTRVTSRAVEVSTPERPSRLCVGSCGRSARRGASPAYGDERVSGPGPDACFTGGARPAARSLRDAGPHRGRRGRARAVAHRYASLTAASDDPFRGLAATRRVIARARCDRPDLAATTPGGLADSPIRSCARAGYRSGFVMSLASHNGGVAAMICASLPIS
jgi:hypothetical protein